MPARFSRYVAIGDSSTEGLDDPDGVGGYRGWSLRLAERIAAGQDSLLYANLGVRGRRTRQIRDGQLPRAVAMRPDLATVFSGTNDIIALRFDVSEVAADMEHMQRDLIAAGATVLTFTLPDLTPVMPLARVFAPRILALNEALRGVVARTGAVLVDFAAHAVATDARLWSPDRLHANSAGHARIAEALAAALCLPGTDDSWQSELPARPSPSRAAWLRGEIRWGGRYLLPWVVSALTGARKERKRQPPRPELVELRGSE